MQALYVRAVICFVSGCLLGCVTQSQDGNVVAVKYKRQQSTKAQFQKMNPCPSTGKSSGACPGYVRDHIVPLGCAKTSKEKAALDVPSNLQWQEVQAAKDKDRWERKTCLQ